MISVDTHNEDKKSKNLTGHQSSKKKRDENQNYVSLLFPGKDCLTPVKLNESNYSTMLSPLKFEGLFG